MADKRAIAPRDPSTPEVTGARLTLNLPSTFRPDDILPSIDAAKKSIGEEPEPGFFERLTVPGAADRSRALQAVKTGVIEARRVYVEQLVGMIDTYVQAHRDDLTIRTQAAIQATFASCLASLNEVTEGALTSLWETYSNTAGRINAIPQLTQDEKVENLRRAFERTMSAEAGANGAFNKILDQIKTSVEMIVKDLGAKRV